MKNEGSVVRNPFFTLVYVKSDSSGPSRFGIVAGRRAGTAVIRNRLKRISRELVRGSFSEMVGGYECILYPKTKILRSTHQEVRKGWRELLKDSRLL